MEVVTIPGIIFNMSLDQYLILEGIYRTFGEKEWTGKEVAIALGRTHQAVTGKLRQLREGQFVRIADGSKKSHSGWGRREKDATKWVLTRKFIDRYNQQQDGEPACV